MGELRLTESDVRGAVESAIEITAIGDGRDERQSINYEFLTKALNDLIEQEASDESAGNVLRDPRSN